MCVVLVKLVLCRKTLQEDLLCPLHFGHPWTDTSYSKYHEFAICSPAIENQNPSDLFSYSVSPQEDETKISQNTNL